MVKVRTKIAFELDIILEKIHCSTSLRTYSYVFALDYLQRVLELATSNHYGVQQVQMSATLEKALEFSKKWVTKWVDSGSILIEGDSISSWELTELIYHRLYSSPLGIFEGLWESIVQMTFAEFCNKTNVPSIIQFNRFLSKREKVMKNNSVH